MLIDSGGLRCPQDCVAMGASIRTDITPSPALVVECIHCVRAATMKQRIGPAARTTQHPEHCSTVSGESCSRLPYRKAHHPLASATTVHITVTSPCALLSRCIHPSRGPSSSNFPT